MEYRHHKNIYFLNRESAESLGPDTPQTTEKLFRYYRDKDVIIIPHHPNVSSGLSFAWRQHDWRLHDDQTERLAEIYQVRGNSETDKSENEYGDYDYGASVRSALARGYKLGFIGGTDTHRSEPASSCLMHPMPSKMAEYYQPGSFQDCFGMAAFLSKALTREGIFDAMKSRRTYATTGDRILLSFYINGHVMGEEITSRVPPRIRVKIWGTDDIMRLDIIKNGKIAFQQKDLSKVVELEWEDKSVISETGESYYYLRIRQHNKQMAWSSPIWVKQVFDGSGKP